MFRFKAVVLTRGLSAGARGFVLAIYAFVPRWEMRCQGWCRDWQTELVPIRVGQPMASSLGSGQRYVVLQVGVVEKSVLFPVTRVKWPARSTMAAGGSSGAVKINRMAWAWHRIPPRRIVLEPRAVLKVIHPHAHASRCLLRDRLWTGLAREG